MGVLADHLLVVNGLATTTYLCWLCRSPLPDKEGYFICLLAMTFSTPYSVCALSLSILNGMHLVIPAHPYFFWMTCHSSKTFPPKNLSKKTIIGFFFSLPITRPCPLTHDPPPLILARYRLVVPGSCVCFTFFTRHSCICRVLEINLYVLPCTFGFLWRGLFSDLSFSMTCFFWGLGLVGSWAVLPSAYSAFILWPY